MIGAFVVHAIDRRLYRLGRSRHAKASHRVTRDIDLRRGLPGQHAIRR